MGIKEGTNPFHIHVHLLYIYLFLKIKDQNIILWSECFSCPNTFCQSALQSANEPV